MEQYITKTQLQSRWGKKLIEMFNPQVAKTKKNHYGGTTMLYSMAEIKKIERRKTFKEAFEKAQSRKQSKEVVEQREQKTMENKIAKFIDNLEIAELPPREQLIIDAINSYNQHKFENPFYEGDFADTTSDKNFLLRITQNYVRHNLTNYDQILLQYCDGRYKKHAYDILKEKINTTVNKYLKAS